MREAHLAFGPNGREVLFRATEHLDPCGDAEIALRLIPSMRTGAEVSVARASPRLLSSVPRIQEIFGCWDEGLTRVEVTVAEAAREDTRGDRVAAFFSGGVDSFYTALRHRDELTDLVFVRGFDFSLEDSSTGDRAAGAARAAARELGLNLIEVETDYRAHVDPLLHWRLGHGPALAVVALLLQRRLRKVMVASTNSYRLLVPLGSHPLVDPLWSTERVAIVHDGADTGRTDKVACIAESPVAMRHLRVCWRDTSGQNCGRCPKCLLTMVELRATDALGRCQTLPGALSPRSVERLRLTNESNRAAVNDALNYLRASGNDPQLASALSRCLQLQPLWATLDSSRGRAGRLRRRLSAPGPATRG